MQNKLKPIADSSNTFLVTQQFFKSNCYFIFHDQA